jgi:hypothetical protein
MTIVSTRAGGAAIDHARPRFATIPFFLGPVLLALDLGSKTGWALHGRNKTITSGTHIFSPNRFEGGGMALLRFTHWLSELKETAGPIDAVFFEEVRGHKGTLAAQIYGGFLAHLVAWAEFGALAYEGVPVATIKKFATGKGNVGKDEVIAAVCRMGHAPQDDNEANAIALLRWALIHRAGEL